MFLPNNTAGGGSLVINLSGRILWRLHLSFFSVGSLPCSWVDGSGVHWVAQGIGGGGGERGDLSRGTLQRENCSYWKEKCLIKFSICLLYPYLKICLNAFVSKLLFLNSGRAAGLRPQSLPRPSFAPELLLNAERKSDEGLGAPRVTCEVWNMVLINHLSN